MLTELPPKSPMPYQIEVSDAGAETQVAVSGQLTLRHAAQFWKELESTIDGSQSKAYRVNLSGVKFLDGASAALLLAAQDKVGATHGTLEFAGGSEQTSTLLDLYRSAQEAQKPPPVRPGLIEQVGAWAQNSWDESRKVLEFLGDVVVAARQACRQPATVNWADVPSLMERAGADGVGIVIIINFLIGLILGMQSAIQLEAFGAGIYIADLVGQSVVRELGPLMTAVVVCGRSGAAYAAELGTMRVSQEVDALRTLGQDPLRYLALPRMIALAAMVPLLTVLADVVGILGGLTVAMLQLDMSVVVYSGQLKQSLTLWAVGGGLIKSAAFGIAIALIACQRGLGTTGGAAGVGLSTTRAVVRTLLVLVLLDALFTTIYNIFGI